MKVQNMTSNRWGSEGRAIPNQFIISDFQENTSQNIEVFQSYNSVIAKRVDGEIYLDKDKWDYSKTTGKYRNIFLGETKKETERKIKDGTYTLADLNS